MQVDGAGWVPRTSDPDAVYAALTGWVDRHGLSLYPHQDEAIIELLGGSNVVLATPTTLMALLRAVAYGWRQERLTEHAEEAGRLGKDLYERMASLAEHLNDVGQSLGKSVLAYNKAVGSLETRILPAARRFKELGVASEKDLPALGPVEVVPRKALPYEEP